MSRKLIYRDVEEMMRERGLEVDRSTVFRWVQSYAPDKYLYHAVDKDGRTIEFMLGAKRDVSAARWFFKKMIKAEHRGLPFSIKSIKFALTTAALDN